ncbi:MAG: GxxExxY protein [Undibacterium sp.]|nr:GxxExxY protein [Opitutaceae bacterium]
MNTDGHGFDGEHAALTREIIGAAMEVANNLGHGLLEEISGNAPLIELCGRGVDVQQQPRFAVFYQGCDVGDFVPKLRVGGAVIVDPKTSEKIGASEPGRMVNCLRITRLTVGLSINFKHLKIIRDRVLL